MTTTRVTPFFFTVSSSIESSEDVYKIFYKSRQFFNCRTENNFDYNLKITLFLIKSCKND